MKDLKPLVSVICLCYNHERFVTESLQSVLDQTYQALELIVVDDGSTDGSKETIRNLIKNRPQITFVDLKLNIGNCQAFNKGLAKARGEFVIDLAADDVLNPSRIEKGVEIFLKSDTRVGVHFSDAEWISEDGDHIYFHSEKFPHHQIPQGDIYRDLIERYFICPPTMMFKREVIDELGGYDENLLYEDFDFWIRSSRKYWYVYSPDVLVKKRIVKNSLTEKQFKNRSRYLESTYQVCKKIFALNRSQDEKAALAKRLRYEITVALRLQKLDVAVRFFLLWIKNNRNRFS